MRKIAIVVVMSVIALASFGVELMSSHNDYGSLVHVAAYDSCAADKARADVVCDGTNAAPAINDIVAQMSARDARGGKIVFFPGTYVVDSWMERPAINANGDHVRRYGILVPHSQSEIVFEGIGYTHKDVNTSIRMNGKGAVFALSKRLWEAMEENGHYSLLGAGPTEKGGLWQYSWGFFRLKDVSFSLPSARNLWGANLAEGANFRTVNTAARRRGPTSGRPTSMTDLGFGYFDTDLNRMVWRTETGWSE